MQQCLIRGFTDTPTDLCALLGDLRVCGKSHAQVCTQMVSQDRCVLLWYIRGLTLLQTCVPYWVILGGVARAMPRFVLRWSLRTGVFYCGILEAWLALLQTCVPYWVILGGVARAMPRFVPRWFLRTGVFYCGILEAWLALLQTCVPYWVI